MGNIQNNQNNEASCFCNCMTNDDDSTLMPLQLCNAYKSINALANTLKSSNQYKNDLLFLIDIKNMPNIFKSLKGTPIKNIEEN